MANDIPLHRLSADDPSDPYISASALEQLAAIVERYQRREQDEPVVSPVPGGTPVAPVPLELPREGRPLDAVLGDAEALISATPKPASKRFVNQLYGGRDATATLAEMLAVVANSQMHTLKVAGPQVLVERTVLAHMASLVGYEDAEGTLVPGGSMSNLVAMIMARNEAVPDAREHGLGGRRLTVYTSVESHYSIRKNMGILGFGRANLRTVPALHAGGLDPEALESMIGEDVAAGAVPAMINATAGTTVLGAFDPLPAIADIARRHGIWFHVDGSYGGSALLSPARRHLLTGAALSDSFAWNPHKMMGIPLLCSVILVRQRGMLEKHLDESAGYLFQSSASYDPGRQSIQCGRRNDALKLWCAWQRHGDAGYARRVERQFALARRAAELIDREPSFRLVRDPVSLNVCFEVEDTCSEAICAHLADQGRVLVGYAKVDGRSVVRLVCVDPSLAQDDLEAFVVAVKDAAAALAAIAKANAAVDDAVSNHRSELAPAVDG